MSGNDVTIGENAATPEAPPAGPERDLYPVAEAAVRVGISERHAWRLIRDQQLRVVRLGGRTLVPAAAITELVARLEAAAA